MKELDASMELKNLKYLVVGSGFFGAVITERIAQEVGQRVAVIEKRNHIGGNSFSELDRETGIECHKYGTHIFHTSNEKVWKYINQFCTFNNYRHKVLARYKDKIYQIPVNLSTINSFYGENFSPYEAEKFLKMEIEKEQIKNPSTLGEKAISMMGRRLYEAFIKGYTIKQWETDPRELPSDTIDRLPVRFNYKSDYFDDRWQGIPIEGYCGLFNKIFNHKNIKIYLNVDFFEIMHLIPDDCLVIYTGPIDQFFNYKFGKLGWRILDFQREVINMSDFQGTSVVNYVEDSIPYTRIHEFKHLHEERRYPSNQTLIFREYSKKYISAADQPYYPINTEIDKKIYMQYAEEGKKKKNLLFGGRLGAYKYLNMDEVILSALETFEDSIKPEV